MTLMETAQLLGNFGEFVGAIAVVGTLGYLAVQIRKNTRSSYVSRQSEATQQLTQLHRLIFANVEVADLVARCRSSALGELSAGDEERVRRLANAYINVYAGAESAYRTGELERHGFDVLCQDFRRTLGEYPALAPYMRTIAEHFDDPHFYSLFAPLFE
jgi:hypothetical protein